MSSSIQLPGKDEFFKDIETLEACDICLDTFNDEHVPVRTKCGHTFGSTCLREWTERTNTCPKCRTPMFIPVIKNNTGARIIDTQAAHWVHNIHDYAHARTFTEEMWNRAHFTLSTHGREDIYEEDVELTVKWALGSTASGHAGAFPGGLHIADANWRKILDVCKDMFQWHDIHFQSARLADDDYYNIWLPKMMSVFDWRLTTNAEPDLSTIKPWPLRFIDMLIGLF
ncbi:hypothetical protein HBI56_217310 [Parastagonospora nodorum]|nr:hypothetical protein HBI56_217310 [Parastagonospora nodorum]